MVMVFTALIYLLSNFILILKLIYLIIYIFIFLLIRLAVTNLLMEKRRYFDKNCGIYQP